MATIYRFEREPYTWQASSSQMMRKGNFSWASNLFHLGILGVAGGHVVGLLVPASLFHALRIPDGAHQLMELFGGGPMGFATLVGLLVLTYRRVFDKRVRRTSDPSDLWIALLLLAALVFGMATLPESWRTRESGEYLHALASWAQGIVLFRPSEALLHLVGVPAVYKIHMALGMTVFLIFPFTRLVHVCSAPLGYLVRGYYQIVRPAQGASRDKQTGQAYARARAASDSSRAAASSVRPVQAAEPGESRP
jgi:nitrate reductase gamma subunit